MNTTILRDALYNLAPKSGAGPDYCKGLVVGIVAGLMATGVSYGAAVLIVRDALPDVYRNDCIPDAFRSDLTG